MIGIIVLILTFLFLASGTWVGVALGLAGLTGYLVVYGESGFLFVGQTMWTTLNNVTLTTLPMFILMGEFLSGSKATRNLFDSLAWWMRRVRGGPLYAALFSAAAISAVAGSSTAVGATVTKSAWPEFQRYGYTRPLSLGLLVAAGPLGILMPPSIALIVYGSLTNTPIVSLFRAGVVPALILVVIFAVFIAVTSPKPKHVEGSERPSARVMISSLEIPVMIAVVLAIIFSGFVSPTEAGAVGAALAMLSRVIHKELDFRTLAACLNGTLKTTVMILFIVVGATLMGNALALQGLSLKLVNFVMGIHDNPIVIFGLICVMYLLLGTIMDSLSIMILTLPFIFPIIGQLGYDPIWFGIVLIVLVEIGLMTPPVGLNLYTTQSITGEDFGKISRGIWQYVVLYLVLIAVLMIYEDLVFLL